MTWAEAKYIMTCAVAKYIMTCAEAGRENSIRK